MRIDKIYTVTGATGYIGGELVKYLLSKEETLKIYAIVREESKIKDYLINEKVVIVKYKKEEDLIEAIKDSDYCIHLAALYTKNNTEEDINNLIDSNIKLSSHIFNMANNYNKNISIVSASTFSSLNEESEISPHTFYAATKTCVEIIAKFYKDLSIKFLTFPDTYGPNDDRPKIHNILNKNKEWPFTFNSNENQKMYIMCIYDLINCILLALEDKDKGVSIYDVFLNADLITLKELTKLLNIEEKCRFNNEAKTTLLPNKNRGKSINYRNGYNISEIKKILEGR